MMMDVLGVDYETYRKFRKVLRSKQAALKSEYFTTISPYLDYAEYLQKQQAINEELLGRYFGKDYSKRFSDATIHILTDVTIELY